MNIPSLGTLYPDKQFADWFTSNEISIPYFDGLPLTFTLDGLSEDDIDDVDLAVKGFLTLGPTDRLAASPYVFKNYQYIASLVSKEDLYCDISDASEVWGHVTPSQIYVSRRHRRDKLIYLQITAECDWEPEHGLQIVYRRGIELSRVSDQDGHVTHTDAYDLPEDQDQIA
jgi:hypothetical protein